MKRPAPRTAATVVSASTVRTAKTAKTPRKPVARAAAGARASRSGPFPPPRRGAGFPRASRPSPSPMRGGVVLRAATPLGTPVVIRPMPGFSKAYAVLRVGFGSLDATFPDGAPMPLGVAHFLEHKMFATPDGDVFDVYAKRGASANAYTTYGLTAYLFGCTFAVQNQEPRDPPRHPPHDARRARRHRPREGDHRAGDRDVRRRPGLAEPRQPDGRAVRPPGAPRDHGQRRDDRRDRPRPPPPRARGVLPPAQPRRSSSRATSTPRPCSPRRPSG